MNTQYYIENCGLSRYIEHWQGNVAILKNISLEVVGKFCEQCPALIDCDPSHAPLNEAVAITTNDTNES